MKKILFILSFIVAIQGMAETIVKGTYDTKKNRYYWSYKIMFFQRIIHFRNI